jgi:hypothetical protein
VRSRPAPRIIVAITDITGVTGETAEEIFRCDEPGEPEQHQHDERDDVSADALEEEHHHREAHQPEHELHVGGEHQRGVVHALGSPGVLSSLS